jgi:hypothetical protein
MKGTNPTMEARALSETVGTSDLDKMLNDYIKPAFIRLNSQNRQKAMDMINQMVSDQDNDD